MTVLFPHGGAEKMRFAALRPIAGCVVLVASIGSSEATSGHVVDPDGKPVAGAKACLLYSGAEGFCTLTDDAGYFDLPDTTVPWARVSAAGFLPRQVAAVEHEAPIALDRAAVLLVRLVDGATGAAIPAGHVYLIDSSGQKKGPLPANAAGVRVSSLEPGEVVVQGAAPGHSDRKSGTIRLQAGEEKEIVLKLDASGS
jgi:hypothetical protein